MSSKFVVLEDLSRDLTDYARVSIAFEVRSVFDVADLTLTERPLDLPYVKDYDSVDGDPPTHWPGRFDLSNWGFFAAAETWARARASRELKIETQNVNVPACRFYAGRGCVLRAAHRLAYPDLPHEIQLLWYKELERGGHVRSVPITS